MSKERPTKLRAAGYCRTSGEGQRNNTSIPRQREAIEKYAEGQGWHTTQHYVDESISGHKVEGRDAFQQMMRDAANGLFDVVVVYDITRFARNGADIIDKARFLRSTFGIYVVDTKGQFDNRSARNILACHLHAGVSEHERLSIMERMIGGRIARAREGRPWCGHPPYGRAYDKAAGKWYLTPEGIALARMCERYAAGERLTDIYGEYGFTRPSAARTVMREGQLSGPFKTRFNAPEIDIIDLEIEVPGMPEVITPELEARVRARAEHNRNCNKEKLRKYKLTGYLRCGHCGYSLGGATNRNGSRTRYQHHSQPPGGSGRRNGTMDTCGFCTIPADIIEPQVLGYLYGFYTDQPAFEAAVREAMPSDDERAEVAADLERARAGLARVDRGVANLVRGIEAGADPALMVSRQDELRMERAELETRVAKLEDRLAGMPPAEVVRGRALAIQLLLAQTHGGKDWRRQSYDDTRRFLQFLFGDNPRKSGYGITVTPEAAGGWRVAFRGQVRFGHVLTDGVAMYEAVDIYAKAASKRLQTEYELALAAARAESKRLQTEYEQTVAGAERVLAEARGEGATPPNLVRGTDSPVHPRWRLVSRQAGCRRPRRRR